VGGASAARLSIAKPSQTPDEKSVIHPTRGVSGVMAEQKRRSSEYSGLPERSGKAMIGKDF